MEAHDRVKLARATDRPTAMAYINGIFSNFTELGGDRAFSNDLAVVGGIARLDKLPVTVIGIEKGHNTDERIRRRFGSPNPEGYRKALRLMKQAEKFRRPVITFVDTAGAYCGEEAEMRGQGQAIAENIRQMMGLSVPVVTVVIGEGGSGGALGLAVADKVYMLENAVYSVISPEGCAEILFKDPKKSDAAAAALRITAEDMIRLGVAEETVRENFGDFLTMCIGLKNRLLRDICTLSAKDTDILLSERYARFRGLGAFRSERAL